MLTDIFLRIRALVRRRTVERELADELRFHLERETEKHLASGFTPADAARRARLDFGGMAQITEDCRDARGIALVETVVQDVRYGIRTMQRTPMFSGTAIATIALATAAIATVACLADTLLWRPPAVEHAETLVVVGATRGRGRGDGAVSYPDYVRVPRSRDDGERPRRALFDGTALCCGRRQRERSEWRRRVGQLLSAPRPAARSRSILSRR